MLCFNKGNIAHSSCSIWCTSYRNEIKKVFWVLIFEKFSVPTSKLHRKNLLKFMSGKNMGIPIYFPWIGKKYSHTLGNLWKLVSHIWKLCGFLNSIDFDSKPMVWEYISFPHNIPIVWNFTLPIIHFFHILGIVWISASLKIVEKPTTLECLFFSHTFPVLWKFTFPKFWELYGFLLYPKCLLRNP